MEAKTVEETLKERGSNYGSYKDNNKEFANIMESLDAIHVAKTGKAMAGEDLIPLFYIVMKIVRLAATPNHIDSWHDIQGYAKLAEDMYNEHK